MRTGYSIRNVWAATFAVILASNLLQGAPTVPNKIKPVRVGTYGDLLKLLEQHQPRYGNAYLPDEPVYLLNTGIPLPVAGGAAMESSGRITQVAGVDESDIVASDGTIIYQINQGRVLAIRAGSESGLGVIATLDFAGDGFYPQGLYLDDWFLTVVGGGTTGMRNREVGYSSPLRPFYSSSVKAVVYDVRNPANPVKVRELEVEGNGVATRKIGSCLYMVARHYPVCYAMDGGLRSGFRETTALPMYRDSRQRKGRPHLLDIRNCYYFPGYDDPNYLIVAGIDLRKPSDSLDINAYLGAGDCVFVSRDNLYVSASRSIWDDIIFLMTPLSSGDGSQAGEGETRAQEIAAEWIDDDFELPHEQTDVYKFALRHGKSRFVAGTTVSGSVLNSYSMDEYQGFFRVATTEHAQWWMAGGTNSSSLYVFNSNLDRVGALEHLAPGEILYAARFLGDRAFLVTFRQIDPLFAIDLADPTKPQVAGSIELPGYSSFLLPYDANHLIGFGRNVAITDEGRAIVQGIKIALFDVTDLATPALVNSLSIGDVGTYSEALCDPHAIYFDHDRGTFAFPITVATVADSNNTFWGFEYTFQGACVCRVTPEAGVSLQGTVTHKPDGGNLWDTWGDNIERVLGMGSNLISLSSQKVKVHDRETLADIATLELPQPTNNVVIGMDWQVAR